MTPERIAELRTWCSWAETTQTLTVTELLDLLATAQREAKLREALEQAVEQVDQSAYMESPDDERERRSLVARIRQALEQKEEPCP